MVIFNGELFEARRNPADNPKIAVRDALSAHHERAKKAGTLDRTFVHFTSIEKLGINPQFPATSDSPVGIYGWPLELVAFQIEHKMREIAPVFTDRKYAIVFEADASLKGLKLSYDKSFISEEECVEKKKQVADFLLANDMKVPNAIRGKKSQRPVYPPERDRSLETDCDLFLFVKRAVQENDKRTEEILMTKIFMLLGYNFVYDIGTGYLFNGSENWQIVFFGVKGLKVLDMIENKERRQKVNTGELAKLIKNTADSLLKDGIETRVELGAPVTGEMKLVSAHGKQRIEILFVLQHDFNNEQIVEIMRANVSKNGKRQMVAMYRDPETGESLVFSAPFREFKQKINQWLRDRITGDFLLVKPAWLNKRHLAGDTI